MYLLATTPKKLIILTQQKQIRSSTTRTNANEQGSPIIKMHDWVKTKELQPPPQQVLYTLKIDHGAFVTLYRAVHLEGIDRALGTL